MLAAVHLVIAGSRGTYATSTDTTGPGKCGILSSSHGTSPNRPYNSHNI